MAESARAVVAQRARVRRGLAELPDLIGNTSLVRLTRIRPGSLHVQIYAKAEWENPGGSIKDRPALNIIREAEKAGRMARDKILIDSTSGNTGIAYAMIGASRGYQVKLCMPLNVSPERKRILRAYGAEIDYTDPMQGSDGAIERVRALVQENPGIYFYANQYDNPANWRAHYLTTANEIWEQTEGRLTHFVAGLGTSGTFMGTTRRLKELNPQIQCVAFQPDSPFHGLEGMKYMPSSIQPGIYNPDLADASLEVATEEAHRMTLRLAREEGLLVGVSSGAAMVAALKLANCLTEGVVVTVFPDSGDKYLSERFWEEGQ